MEVHSKMKGWNDLPFEMKCEVFKYMEQKDRFKFAKCSWKCLNEVLHEEKDIFAVKLEGINKKLFILTINSMSLKFKQIGKFCEIENDGEIIWKGVGNGKTMAYKFCESILAKNKNNLYSLNLSKVDFMIRDKSIANFPKLEVFKITTNNEKQLYSFLSKIENVYDLTVNFRDFGNTENSDKIRFPENSKLPNIVHFNLISNNADVALKIIDKMKKPEYKYFKKVNVSIIDGKLADVDEKFISFFKKCDYLTTNLILTDDQFEQLTLMRNCLKLNAEKINASTIATFIDDCIQNGISKELHLTNVHGLEKLSPDFMWLHPKMKKVRTSRNEWIDEIVPNEYVIKPSFLESFTPGSYNSSTGRLNFFQYYGH
ncbi:unnamed protein product [Caenorhabditis angaria]|uniref:F-box domain-containing protein n=1 Tax=Caenorhabditis angaria TaxID=860376 RepID=A0A9P1IBS7_9PELO|nr:unnamed protein product [Caenorhabditis angaria]